MTGEDDQLGAVPGARLVDDRLTWVRAMAGLTTRCSGDLVVARAPRDHGRSGLRLPVISLGVFRPAGYGEVVATI